MVKPTYDHKDIKVIAEIEHIRMNPGMYVSETSNPVHLVEEALDNSLDECLAGFADIVAVDIDTKSKTYSVLDNGRGIPIEGNVPEIISTKLFSGSKFKDSKSVYTICCLHGSTKIMLLDGQFISIEEMSKNPDKEYWGLSSTEKGKFTASKLLAPQVTGFTKHMVRVYLDNEKVEECTPEHLFMLHDGSYKKAEDLTEQDSLMPCYYKEQDGYIMIRPNFTYEYERNIKMENRQYVPLHRLVYESVFGEIPKFYAVHHSDMDRKNNVPSNFKLLHDLLEHLPEHSRINSKNGTVNVDGLIRYNKSERGRQKSRENGLTIGSRNLTFYAKSDRNRQDKHLRMIEYNKKTDPKFLQKCKILKHCKRLLNKEIEINEQNWNSSKQRTTRSFKTSLLYFSSLENMIEESKEYNHSVLKIEHVYYKKEIPVYDVYVPEYSNFVLESGIIVHNSGLHGIGLVAVNALSELYIVEIYRDNKHAIFIFENSKLKEKKIEDFKGDKPFSTKVMFKPDRKIFETLLPDLNRLRNRLLIASVELSGCTFVLNVDEKKEVIKLDTDTFFKEHCLSDNDSELSPTIDVQVKDGIETITAKFCYATAGSISPKIQSSINLLPVESGGTHITLFVDILRNLFSAAGKKSGMKFQPQDSITGLRAYLNLELKEPEFSGQTKDRLINRRSYFQKLENKLSQTIEKTFSTNPELLLSLLKHFEDYRQRLDLRKMKITTGNGKRASTKFTKLRDCVSRNGELFIVEGDSAESGLLQCRDAKFHAILPLKGKIPSIINIKDILENNEIKEIINALGIGFYPNVNISNLRYSKIIILTDADPDGGHIASILILDLAMLVPDLVKTGHLYVAETPLYSINDLKRGIFLPLWSKEELDKAVSENKPIIRAKGLGEFNPEQLKIFSTDQKTRKLYQVKYTANLEKLSKLFSDVNTKRELLEGKFKI